MSDAPIKKPCALCCEQIPLQARLCRHCHSYQDWRRHLNLSSTVLALLVALVTVLAAAVPVVANALRSSRSELVLSSPVIRGETVYLVASNLGSNPGIIQRGLIHSRYLGIDSELVMSNPADAFVTRGARHVGMRVHLQMGAAHARDELVKASLDGLRSNPRNPAGHIGIWVRESSGEERFVQLPISYEDVSTLLETHHARCEALQDPPSLRNGCSGLRELQAENDRLHRAIQEEVKGAVAPRE